MTGLSPESRMPDTHQPLVSPEWLAQHLHHPDLAILDVRLVAGEDWRAAFEAGHIPGATFTDYAKDGWRAAKGMAVGMLPDAAALSALFGRLGLAPDRHAVVVPTGVNTAISAPPPGCTGPSRSSGTGASRSSTAAGRAGAPIRAGRSRRGRAMRGRKADIR